MTRTKYKEKKLKGLVLNSRRRGRQREKKVRNTNPDVVVGACVTQSRWCLVIKESGFDYCFL